MGRSGLRILVVRGVLHWGFSVRIPGTSAGGATYPTIPPSTVLGALSRTWCAEKGYATKNNKSCTEEFINNVASKAIEYRNGYPGVMLAIEAPYTTTLDVMRQQRVTYRRSTYRTEEYRDEWFGVSAFGKAYTPAAHFKIYLILKNGIGELARLAWTMTSLGTKESVVSIEKVEEKYAPEADNGVLRAYAPAPCLKTRRGLTEIDLPISNVYQLSNRLGNLSGVVSITAKYLLPTAAGLYGIERRITRSEVSQDCSLYAVDENEVVVWYA